MTWLLRLLTLGLWKPKPDLQIRAYVEGRYKPTLGIPGGDAGWFTTYATTEAEARKIEKTLNKMPGMEAESYPLNQPMYYVNGKIRNHIELKFCPNDGLIGPRDWYWNKGFDEDDVQVCRFCDNPLELGQSLPEKEVLKRVQEHEKARAA